MDASSAVQPSITPGLGLNALAQFGKYPKRARTRSYISRTGPSASAGSTVPMNATLVSSSSCPRDTFLAPSLSSSSPQTHREANEAHQRKAGLDNHRGPEEPGLRPP